MTQPIVLYAGFDKGTDPVTGLTVTVNVYRITRSSGASSQIVTAGSATALGDGVYLYAIGAADLQTYDYLAAFKTTGDVDKKTVWAVYPPLANAYATELARLDATVSSRNATTPLDSTATQAAAAAALTAYDPPTKAELDAGLAGVAAPSAAAVADAVASVDPSGYGVGTAGYAWAAAGSAADPLLNLVPGSYASGTAGYYLGRLANSQIDLVSVFDPVTKTLSYYYGDDYAADESRQQTFTTELDLSGNASVAWIVGTSSGVKSINCAIVDAHTYSLEVTAENLTEIGVGIWPYDFEITLDNGHTVTEITGQVLVSADVR